MTVSARGEDTLLLQQQQDQNNLSWDEIKRLLQDSDAFQLSSTKAWSQVLMTIAFLTLGIIAAAMFPWYLLPISWFFVGLCASGLMGVAYACSENRFFNQKTMPSWVNDLVGMICMLPLLYPFEAFKTLANKSEEEKSQNANQEDEGFVMKALAFVLKSPLWFLSSIFDWFRANIYFETKKSIVINAVVLYVFAAAFFSLMVYFVGLWGLVKFYIAPLIAYHLINSTFMKVNDADAKKNTITHFPSIIEFLTNYANHSYRIKLKWNKKTTNNNTNNNDTITQSLKEKLIKVVPNYNWNKAKNALCEKFGKNLEGIGGTTFFSDLGKTFENEVDLRNIDWFITVYLIGSVVGTIYGVLTCAFNWKTYVLSFIGYYIAGIGITAGYHRVFAHRSCKATWPVRVFLMLLGTSAFQGSVVSWSADHRRHHQYVDTERDPYNINNSFFYAHMGWLMWKREVDTTNAKDLLADPVIKFHHEYYPYLAVFLGYLCPMMIAGFGWGDWYGGFFIAGILSKTFLQHCTFFINSLAHSWGVSTFNDDHTAKDSYIVSLFTFGEGYHNFHHTFAYDYRNGVRWYHYDPGKWLLYMFSLVGMTYDLKRCDPIHYEKGKIIMMQKKLDDEQMKIDEEKKLYDWGTPLEKLPTKSYEEFQKDCKSKSLIIIDDVVHDVTKFIGEHPGGETILKAYLGKDATKAFKGDVYLHTNVAKNILAQIRIYKLAAHPKSD